MRQLTEEIKEKKIMISDGAWGTMLIKKGLDPGACPESWNIQHPDKVQAIAEAYLRAGANMVETNSFGGSRIKLQNHGLHEQVEEINQTAARLSRLAAGPDRHVLGSVGPTGKILLTGETSPEELYDIFREQVTALEKGGADVIIVETMSDLEEAGIAIRAAKENTLCEVVCTMTFEITRSGDFRTIMGISPAEIPEMLREAGADIIGSNCGNGTEQMLSILRELRSADPDIPVMIQPNAGVPKYEKGETVYSETPAMMASFMPDMIRNGVSILGGCCGTTPGHIEKIAEAVNKEFHG